MLYVARTALNDVLLPPSEWSAGTPGISYVAAVSQGLPPAKAQFNFALIGASNPPRAPTPV